jgi:hypothetical protein
MDIEQIPILTIHISPLIRKNSRKPILTKRLRPEDTLNLPFLQKEVKPNTLITLSVKENPWSIISVLSPYTPLQHVMIMETSSQRYLPGIEKIGDKEGDALTPIFNEIIKFIKDQDQIRTIGWGYNWSPRSWGSQEEKTGFQSIPTKWHTMIWGWPSLKDHSPSSYLSFANRDSLNAQQKRLLGDNLYAEVLGSIIKSRLKQTLSYQFSHFPLLPISEWIIDQRGLLIPFQTSITGFFQLPGLFSLLLKPIAATLNQLMTDLTESFTTMNCSQVDQLLSVIKKRPLTSSELEFLRKTPSMKSSDQIKSALTNHGFKHTLLNVLLEPIRNRCLEQGNPENWWRKGFGYALVIHGNPQELSLNMRIMPGVYNGPGGMVEALGVILQRPENIEMKLTDIKAKSDILWKLAEKLKSNFSIYK